MRPPNLEIYKIIYWNYCRKHHNFYHGLSSAAETIILISLFFGGPSIFLDMQHENSAQSFCFHMLPYNIQWKKTLCDAISLEQKLYIWVCPHTQHK